MKTVKTIIRKPAGWFVVGCIVVALAGAGIWLIRSEQNHGTAEAGVGQQVKRVPVVVTRPVRRTFE
jgi:hypothetical protein